MLDDSFDIAAYRRSRDGSVDLSLIDTKIYNLEYVSLSLTTDISLTNRNYLVSVNASSAPITVTLASASVAVGKTCTVSKTDTSGNHVTITSSSMIAGDTSFDLVLQYESLTLFSDGAQWLAR